MGRSKGLKKGAAQHTRRASMARQSPREVECFDEDEVLLQSSAPCHPDDWPCFVLQDAVVLDKVGNFANLLNAETDGPLFVRGQLWLDKESRHLLRNRDLKGAQVSVQEVCGFSMGTDPITIWALGNVRWFEIRPSPEYQQVYKKMMEGVALYYFLVETYESQMSRPSNKTVSMDSILKQYSEQNDREVTEEVFLKLCEEHALFLFSQMLKPHEPVIWPLTKFYKWLVLNCPNTYEKYKNEIGEGQEATPPEITETLKHLYASGRHRREKLTLRQLSRGLFTTFNFSSLLLAQEFIRIHAEGLLMKLRLGWEEEDWQLTPLFLKLEEMTEIPGKHNDLRNEASLVHLKRRIKATQSAVARVGNSTVDDGSTAFGSQSKRRSLKSGSGNDTSSSKLSATPAQHPHQSRKYANKGKDRRISRDEDMPDFVEMSSSDVDESGISCAGRSDHENVSAKSTPLSRSRAGPSRSGKKTALRPVKSIFVPKFTISSSANEEEVEGRSKKRRRLSSSDEDDAMSDDLGDFGTSSLDSDSSEDDEIEEPGNADLEFTLESQTLPSITPQSSNGLWTCDRKGCNHSITKANEEEGRVRVLEHFKEHANEIAFREKLILQESKSGLKVNHLLEKIRKMGEQARLNDQKKINGRLVPLPIKGRLLS